MSRAGRMQSARRVGPRHLPIDNVNGYCRPLSPALLFCQACCVARRLQEPSATSVGISGSGGISDPRGASDIGYPPIYRLAAPETAYLADFVEETRASSKGTKARICFRRGRYLLEYQLIMISEITPLALL
jgi:hypothetical protein